MVAERTLFLDSLPFGPDQPGSNVRISQFLAASLTLHLILLLALRAPGDPDGVPMLPDLLVRLEFVQGRDPEPESPPPVAESQPVPSTPSEPLVTESDEAARAVDVASIPEAPESSQAVLEEGVIETLASTAEASSEPGALADTSIVTTTGPSDIQVDAEPEPIPGTEQGQLTAKVMQGIQTLQSTDASQLRLSWQEGERSYVAMLKRVPAADGMDIERATIDIETEEHGERLRTQLQLKRLAFSHYTQLVDRWDREVQLHDDIVSGRFHSNSEILVGYDRKTAPLFMGKVTTAARGFALANNIGRRRQEEIFAQGIETRAERIRFPEKLLGIVGEHSTSSAVHTIEGEAHIIFFANGSYGAPQAGSSARELRQIDPATPTYILGAPNSTLYLSGAVRGKVLVYSPNRIVITGNLTYARDPRTSADSEDYLGLVSDKDIEVASPRVTGPGDLNIHGAVYARRRFEVNDYESRPAGTLFIYGSLTAGSISATEPRYATTVEFDPRFERVRPPGFPHTNKFEIEKWDLRWQPVTSEALPAPR